MRRAKWGIGAVAVAGLAWLLSTLFNFDLGGLGIGQYAMVPSDGTRTEQPPPEESIDPVVDSESEHGASEHGAEEQLVSTANPEAAVGVDGRVEVRIEDREYLLRAGSDATWVKATLETVVAAAKAAPGDDAGVRVRVLRGPSSRASAEDALYEALQGGGIQASEIVIPDIEAPQRPAG